MGVTKYADCPQCPTHQQHKVHYNVCVAVPKSRWQGGRRGGGGPRACAPWELLSKTCPRIGDAPKQSSPLLTARGTLDPVTLTNCIQSLEKTGVFVCTLGEGAHYLLSAAMKESQNLAKGGSVKLAKVEKTQHQDPVRAAWLRSLGHIPGALHQIYTLLSDLGLALKKELLDRLGVELTSHTDGLLACYDTGEFQRPHWDVKFHAMNAGTDRRITTITYLNQNWNAEDGGALRIFDTKQQGWFTVWPELGTVVVFRADRVLHEVQLAKVKRTALTVWHIGHYATPT